MAWTFGGISFVWLDTNTNGVATVPTWNRVPRLNVRPLLGLGDADVSRVGYEPYTMAGEVYIATTAATASLVALNGTAGALSDGTSTWTAVLTLSVNEMIADADGGHTGTATFIRPRATG